MTYGYGQMDTRPGEPMEPTGMVGKGVGEQEERNMIELSLHRDRVGDTEHLVWADEGCPGTWPGSRTI